jgi:hypothetical protein
VAEAAMRRGPQAGLAVAWHNYIAITCYNANWRNTSFLKTGASYYSNRYNLEIT